MKLLFLLQELPYPPSNGFRQKIFSLISYMGHSHQCDVLSLGTQDDLDRSTKWIRQIPGLRILGIFPPDRVPFLRIKQLYSLLLTSDSPSWLRFRSHALEQAIDRIIQDASYDLVHIDLEGMAQYCKKLGQLRRVLSLNDSMSLTFFGVANNQYAPFLMRITAIIRTWPQMRSDKALFGLADVVHFVGGYDADWCRRRFLVPNAVYLPLPVSSAFLKIERNKEEGDKNQQIIIIDKLWDPQHINAVKCFLSKYWVALYNKHSSAKLIIIGGKGMPTDFQDYVRNMPGVRLYEWVDSLENTLTETSIAVFPYSVAVGMKNRVLQCMAAMNAVVGTPDAFRGLPVEHGQHVFIGKNIHEIANGVEELLASNIRRDQMGRCARALIQNHFTQNAVGEAWERLYADIMKSGTLRENY